VALHNLDKIFKPGSLAIVGASEKKGTIGWDIMRNLIGSGFEGTLIAVNPNYESVQGVRAFPSVREAPQSVDLAIIATPIDTVPSIVGECASTGVGAAIIISAGGRETGGAGLKIEKRIREETAGTKLRILGPNSFGVICPEQHLNTTFIRHMPEPGKMAFISQSGAVCAAMADLSNKEGIGFSHFVSVGSMLDVDFGDLVDYLGNDEDVKSILLYVESLSNVRKFMSAARAVSRVKPIVVLKAGTSGLGAMAAASHTGAATGEDAFYDAAFKRAGIVRAATLEAFFDCAELLNKQPQPSGKRLLVITNSGGAGVMAADAIAAYNLELSPLGKETLEKLDRMMPPHWSRKNPLDLLGDATPERYVSAVDGCFESRNMDGMLVLLNPQAMTDPADTASVLARHLEAKPYPIVTAVMGGVVAEKARDVLNRVGIPTYETPERAVRAFHYLHEYGRNLKMLQEIPPRLESGFEPDRNTAASIIEQGLQKGGALSDEQSKRLLASFGIPVNPTRSVRSPDEAAQQAEKLGYPVVMRLDSIDVVLPAGAPRFFSDLRNQDEVKEAYFGIMEHATARDADSKDLRITIQPLIRNPDYEVFIGARRDPNFGPAVAFGMGGPFADAFADRAIGLPPLNRSLARMVMEETRVFQLLKGYGGRPAADIDLLEEVMVHLSNLVTDFPEIVELTMNPVIVKAGKPRVEWARLLLAPALVQPPLHLVISPYPEHYESRETTSAGLALLIRPIKPEDAPLMLELFKNMSSRSIYYRFFSPIKTLPRSMLAKFTQIDYDRELALVAVEEKEGAERIVGVVRFVCDPDRKRAEFAVAVGDPWQGKGVGNLLMRKCLHAAGEYGIGILEGDVLAENTGMIEMCRKLGFRSSRSRSGDQYVLSIEPRRSNSRP
jgi:acetyltransferase